MRLRHHHHESSSGKINVTPLIDVVMVLIVFYLIVGNLAAQRELPMPLPRSDAGATSSERGVVIGVRRDDIGGLRVTLDDQDIPVADLAGRLRAALPELDVGEQTRAVSLRADRTLAYGDLLPVVQACREAGLSSLHLVAAKEER